MSFVLVSLLNYPWGSGHLLSRICINFPGGAFIKAQHAHAIEAARTIFNRKVTNQIVHVKPVTLKMSNIF